MPTAPTTRHIQETLYMISPINRELLARHLHGLTEDIGVRLAGTDGERRAAEYCESAFARSGARVTRETFPVRSRQVEEERLEILIDEEWTPFPCLLFTNTPGTGGDVVEAPLEFFEPPAALRSEDFRKLRGRAVIHLGCHIESREFYRRLIEARPAFLLLVDVRYPGNVPLADGMFPAYTEAHGAVPTVNVAYQDAWLWRVKGARFARLLVRGGMVPSTSQNVIAELPGSDPEGEVVYISAHHDTQANSPGADDNASGVAAVLELANVLARLPRRRTLRLACFGAEEQLSLGSAAHVRAHRSEISSRGALALNFDSFGSWLGWTELVLTAPEEFERWALRRFEECGLVVRAVREVVPYADHFPFAAAGVPAATLWRRNCASGRFFHHRPDDDLSRVSIDLMAQIVDAVAALVADLASAPELPFPRRLPETAAAEAARFWEDLFGGWDRRDGLEAQAL